MDLETEFVASFGGKGEQAGQINNACSIVSLTPANDHIAVADVNNRRVQVFDTRGLCRVVTGVNHLKCPWNLCAVHPTGHFYLTDGVRQEIVHYDEGGKFVEKFKLRGDYEPSCITADIKQGKLYVSDYNTAIIHVYNSAGTEVHSFGLEPDPEVVAQNPFAEVHRTPNVEHMALDSIMGRFYIAFGTGAQKIHIYDTSGSLLSTFGNFTNVTCVHLTVNGRLVVVDRDRQSISLYGSEGGLLQELLGPYSGLGKLYPQSATIVSGNMLVFSAAGDLYGSADDIFIHKLVRRS